MLLSPNFNAGGTIFLMTYGGGVQRSTDGGQSWAILNTGLSNGYPQPSAISPNYPFAHLVFAGLYNALNRSTSAGGQWTLQPLLGSPDYARSVAVSPNFSSDNLVAMGTDLTGTPFPLTVTYQGNTYSGNGLWLSSDGGQTWAPSGLNGSAIHTIWFSPAFAADRTLFAGGMYAGLFRSTDGGQTWSQPSGFPTTCCVGKIRLSPSFAQDHMVYAAVPSGPASSRGLQRSMDGGNTWNLVTGALNVTVLDFELSSSFGTDHTVFLGTLEKGVLRSQDGGNTWQPTTLSGASAMALAVSPSFAADHTVLAANFDGVYKSDDGGNTWAALPRQSRYEEDRGNLTKSGTWALVNDPSASSSGFIASSHQGDQVQFTFVGSQVSWLGVKGPTLGIATVLMDGVPQTQADLYAASKQSQQVLFSKWGLKPGTQHTLTITVTGAGEGQSSGTAVTIDAFDVWP
jgi:photosystem II stability/assembly factor-like uncharacterized protein